MQVWVELPFSPPLKTYLTMSCSSSRHTHCWTPLCHLPPTNLSSLSPAGNRSLLPAAALFCLLGVGHEISHIGVGVGTVKE